MPGQPDYNEPDWVDKLFEICVLPVAVVVASYNWIKSHVSPLLSLPHF